MQVSVFEGPVWRERAERPGWDCRYTVTGGRRRGESLTGPIAQLIQQAFIAAPTVRAPEHGAPATLSALCMRLLQRGRLPPVAPLVERALAAIVGEPGSVTVADLLDGPRAHWRLDPAIELDARYEAPFWEAVVNRTDLARWVTPQAPLEALARRTAPDGAQRWVDFLVAHPLLSSAYVIEIDGLQHARAMGVDQDRDSLLKAAQVDVLRRKGGACLHLLDDQPLGPLSTQSPLLAGAAARRRAALAPAAVQRFVFAVLEALRRGLLTEDAPWVLDVEDPLDVITPCAGHALDLIASVDALHGFGVVPRAFTINGCVWERTDARFRQEPNRDERPATVRIVIDPDLPPHAALPDQDDKTIVIRSAFLPVDLPFEPGPRERHPVESADPAVLERLAVDLFGVTALRPGQAAAIARPLTGRDALVLMPTAGGKSLIYQLAGLLSPGLTIVVDPIVALIDDQARRLREEGIDRVLGLHGSLNERSSQADIVAQLVDGGALFVFVAPERLQIAGFRAALSAAAKQRLVGLAVVDEAHCVSEWGHDFRTSYLRLGRTMHTLCADASGGRPPLLAMTGTASPAVLRDIRRDLDIAEAEVLTPDSYDRPNLRFLIRRRGFGDSTTLSRAIRDSAASRLATDQPPAAMPGLIFNQTVNGPNGLYMLQELAATAASVPASQVEIYCGGKPDLFGGAKEDWDKAKAIAAQRFMRGEATIMVATKAFGMGVDKSDIRWTVHAGMPASIEAFAQEAGRAGRDGRPATCMVVAAPPTGSLATTPSELLDRTRGSDLNTLAFFLDRSFEGADVEFATACEVLDDLRNIAPMGAIRISRAKSGPRPRPKDATETKREKGLYRLMLLGVVTDYTVDFGGGAFDVDVGRPSVSELDAALLSQAQRLDPGNRRWYIGKFADAPTELDDRARHHLKLLIGMVYRRVRPARARALYNMYRLVAEELPEDALRKRINAYLGDGPLAAILPILVLDRDDIDVSEVIDAFSATPSDDGWLGTSARQLEDTPEHPVALLAGALAEAWASHGERKRFAVLLGASWTAMRARGVRDEDAACVAAWLLRQLDGRQDGRRRNWRLEVWRSISGWLLDEPNIRKEESAVLRTPAALAIETNVVLTRRMAATAERLETWSSEWGGARDG